MKDQSHQFSQPNISPKISHLRRKDFSIRPWKRSTTLMLIPISIQTNPSPSLNQLPELDEPSAMKSAALGPFYAPICQTHHTSVRFHPHGRQGKTMLCKARAKTQTRTKQHDHRNTSSTISRSISIPVRILSTSKPRHHGT